MQQLLKRTNGDKVIWGIVITLSLFGLLVVYSSASSLAYKKFHGHTERILFMQVAYTCLGLGIMWLAHRVNYYKYNRMSLYLFLACIPLLAYTLFFGAEINEGSRWIKIPIIGITFQSSDFAKLALFMFLARQLSRLQPQIDDLKVVAINIFLPVAIIVAFIAPANLSTALMLCMSCGLLFFIGGVRLKHLGLLFIAAIIGVGILYGVGKITGTGRAATWEKRIMDFNKSETAADQPYQVLHAKMAIAKGGIFGVGPGNSTERNFLPQAFSDMVYPFIIEEYGLLGGFVVLALYLLLLWRSILLFRRCPYAFGAFLAVGLSFTLVFQAMLNMGVGVNLLPVTGLTLPFLSKGGTSLIFTSITIGIILSVSKYVEHIEGDNAAKDKKDKDSKDKNDSDSQSTDSNTQA
jgi:cell division protein FtsW